MRKFLIVIFAPRPGFVCRKHVLKYHLPCTFFNKWKKIKREVLPSDTTTTVWAKDHWRFGPSTPIFLIPRTLLLSVSAIGESNGKSQLAKYFQISYALERYGG